MAVLTADADTPLPFLPTDPRVTAVHLLKIGEPLVELDVGFRPARAVVRAGLADLPLAARDCGLTPQSRVPRMFAAAGTTSPRLLELLVSPALAGPSGGRGNPLRGCMDDVYRPARERRRPSPR